MLAAVIAAIAISAVTAAAAAADPGDVEAVYCLSDVHRAEVVLAAARLGKGAQVPDRPTLLAIGDSPKRVVSLEDWRRLDRADFNRVCSALIKANSINPAGNGGSGRLDSALLVVLGAVLTVLGTFIERTGQHRRERLDRLATAIDDFRGSAEDYLEKWQYDPTASHDDVAAGHRKLVDALRGLRAAGSRRKEVRALSGAGVPLARQFSNTITDEAGEERTKGFTDREKEIAELRRRLNAALARAELLAGGTVRWRGHRAKKRLHRWSGAARHILKRIRPGRGRSELPGGDGR